MGWGSNLAGGRRASSRRVPSGRTRDVTIQLYGDKELERKLKNLPDAVLRKVVRHATPRAMKPVNMAAKRKVRPVSKLIARSIGTKTKTYRRSGVVITVVGPRRGFKDPVTGHNPVNTAHLVEFGTKPHAIKTRTKRLLSDGREVFGSVVQHPGTYAVPFMRPAMDDNKYRILGIYRQELASGVEREALRA